MDFKFDIRILAASLLFHFFAYGLLSLYTPENKTPNMENIEVVIQDNSNERTFLATPPKQKETPQEETENSKFFSDQPKSFEKESIAKNLGNFKNQNKASPEKSKNQENPKIEPSAATNFMPVTDKKSTQDERQSTVNFQVPNLAKGDLTFLNSDFSTYASFYNRITPKIMYTWGNSIDDIALFPHMREKLRKKLKWSTKVELILNKTGHYKDIIVINSSGSDELDQAVVESLREAGPYLNPPSGMMETDGTVHITGEFTVYTQRPHYANPN